MLFKSFQTNWSLYTYATHTHILSATHTHILSATQRTFQNLSSNNHHFSWMRNVCHTALNCYLQMSPLLKPLSIFLTKLMFMINYLNYVLFDFQETFSKIIHWEFLYVQFKILQAVCWMHHRWHLFSNFL